MIGHPTFRLATSQGQATCHIVARPPFRGRGGEGGGRGGWHEIRREADRKEEKRTGESVRGKVHV